MRVELKYCVPEDVAAWALQVAGVFLRPDDQAAGDTQQITSLYLDSPSLTFLRWHLDGVPDRFKLRVRAYGAAPHPTVYAEVKRKQGVICRKRRAGVHGHALRALLDGSRLPCPIGTSQDAAALSEFVWRKVTFGATPKVMTRCMRAALRGGHGDEGAVTVDRSVVFRRVDRRQTLSVEDGWRPLPLLQHAGRTTAVLELKHGPHPPAWIARIVRELAPWRTSFSKYVAAMRSLEPWQTC